MDRQDGETVVPAECTEDGIDLGIDKASTGDTGLEVIQPDHLPRSLQSREEHSRHSE